MEGAYFADWSELPKDDLDRWKEEKAKRMLAWIHTLHGNEHVGAETPWCYWYDLAKTKQYFKTDIQKVFF